MNKIKNESEPLRMNDFAETRRAVIALMVCLGLGIASWALFFYLLFGGAQ